MDERSSGERHEHGKPETMGVESGPASMPYPGTPTRKQRGLSLLFLLLIVALVLLVAASLALPRLKAAQNEKYEKDFVRGAAPKADPARAAANERAQAAEFAATHGDDFKAMRDTPYYLALSPRCRGLVDAHVDLLDKPADAATDNASVRASAAEIERSFEAECVDSAPPAAATGSSLSRAATHVDRFSAAPLRSLRFALTRSYAFPFHGTSSRST